MADPIIVLKYDKVILSGGSGMNETLDVYTIFEHGIITENNDTYSSANGNIVALVDNPNEQCEIFCNVQNVNYFQKIIYRIRKYKGDPFDITAVDTKGRNDTITFSKCAFTKSENLKVNYENPKQPIMVYFKGYQND